MNDTNNDNGTQELSPENQAILASLVDPDAATPTFNEHTENDILAFLLTGEANQFLNLIKPHHYKSQVHQWLHRLISEHYKEFGAIPNKNALYDRAEQKHSGAALIQIKAEYCKLSEFYKIKPCDVAYINAAINQLLSKYCILNFVNDVKVGLKAGNINFLQLYNDLGGNLVNLKKHFSAEQRIEAKKFYTLADLEAFLPKQEWLIKDHILANSVVSLYGSEASYKSFLAVDWAYCVANGKPYLNQYQAKKGTVAYICSEGAYGISKRLRALEDYYKLPSDGIRICPTNYNFVELTDAIELIRQLPQSVQLVIIDTKARNFMGKEDDENTGKYIRSMDHIRQETGAAIVTITHCGKDVSKLERGSNQWRCAVDTAFYLEKENDTVTIINDKQKDYAALPTYQLTTLPHKDSLILSPVNKILFNLRSLPEKAKEVMDYIVNANLSHFSFSDLFNTGNWKRATLSDKLRDLAQRGLIIRAAEGSFTLAEEVQTYCLFGTELGVKSGV